MDAQTPSKYVYQVEGFSARAAIDARQLAKDLAAELGGTFAEKPPLDSTEPKREGSFTIDGARVSIYATHGDSTKATLHIDADVDWTKTSRPYVSEYRQEYKTPTISVSVARPIETLAKDVRRRLIDAGKAAVAARLEFFERQTGTQRSLAQAKQRLEREYGKAIRVRLEERAESNGSFDLAGEGVYGNGRFYSDGSVQFDRIGTVSAEQFEAILRILRPKAFEQEQPSKAQA